MPHRPTRASTTSRALCGGLLLAAIGVAAAQQDEALPDGVSLTPSRALRPPPRGDAARALPAQISARELRGRPDLDAEAVGDVDFRRGGLRITADRLHYDQAQDRARANGSVRLTTGDGNVYSGPEVALTVQRFEGYFLEPTFLIARTGSRGSAARIDFIDADRSVSTAATYTSCTADGGGAPAWLLQADRVRLDLERNEGVAEGARLRFLGITTPAMPRMSFPLTDERKSGWLPPFINLDNRSGLQAALPYYWNIAPNRDATLMPIASTRRGFGVDAEYRYLEPRFRGVLHAHALPHDMVAQRSRYGLDLAHDGAAPAGWDLRLRTLRVSDNDYWKDFPRVLKLVSPRLLPTDLQATRTRDWNFSPAGLTSQGDWTTYVRIQRWQPIQDVDPANAIVAPYERLPQVGVRTRQRFDGGADAALETEVNHFVSPPGFDDATRFRGVRAHTVGSFAWPRVTPGWTLSPRLAFNAAAYDFDQLGAERRHASRLIPTASLDSAWFLERETRLFGSKVRQTLEPRLRYVYTPYRNQSALPNFDAAKRDFNIDAIYTDNDFTGIDRVSDANHLTGGVTTRVIEPTSGAEVLRLGVVQRLLFRDQRITPEGVPFTQRFSDLLVFGATTLVPRWTLEGSLQYSPATDSTSRSIMRVRYSPGPFRTVNATYRFTRDQSEQAEIGWQWPIAGPEPLVMEERRRAGQAGAPAGSSCNGTWYTVGRLNYSLKDSRLTDSIVGLEYDAGCWIVRVVGERLSTGRSEATTRLLLQLELVGLSRVGSNPLQALKDNIPGYRLLRDDRTTLPTYRAYD